MNQSPEVATIVTADAYPYTAAPAQETDSGFGTAGLILFRIGLIAVVVVVKLAILAAMK